MRHRRVVATITVLTGLATGILVNLFSDLFSMDTPASRFVAGVALLTCTAVALRLELRRSAAADRNVMLGLAAERLRNSLVERFEAEPGWENVADGTRMPVRWVPESDGGAQPEPVDPGERLAGLWLADTGPHRLVLLGEGGSGKTELLIGVFRQLLETWVAGEPVPVLIPMTAWRPSGRAIDWIVEWLTDNHRFLTQADPGGTQLTLAAALLHEGRLALLLDGLDEVSPDYHAAALGSLNSLPRSLPILLSSRRDEFDAVRSAHRRFSGAIGIVLQRQSADDVLDYLTRDNGDPRWEQVLHGIWQRPDLAAVLNRPLMVMLADVRYNGQAGGEPREMLALLDAESLSRHLLDGFVPAVYPAERVIGNPATRWTAHRAQQWLGHLARLLGTDTDLHWWELPEPRTERVASHAGLHAVTATAVVVWTALSAGLMYGAAFSLQNGITDAVRMSAATLICYFGVLHLTGRFRDALLGAVGAYIAGVLSGSFDVAVGLGLVAAFAWGAAAAPGRRPVPAAVLVGAATGGVAAAIHAVGTVVGLDDSLTRGFAGGAADGFTSRWDGAVPGTVATGLVAGVVTWAALTFTARPRTKNANRWRDPVVHSAVTAVAVGLLCWATEHAFWPAAADGLTAGLAVWWVSHWVHLWIAGPRPGSVHSAVVVACVYAAVAVAGYAQQADIRSGWGRALSEAIAAGLIVGLARAVPSAADPRWLGVRRWALAVTAAVVTGGLDAMTGFDSSRYSTAASVARGIATGVAVGIVALVMTERLGRSHVDTKPGRIAPVETAVFVMVLVGLLAGFAWALMYGSIAGLGCRVARDIALRRQPSMNLLPSPRGAVVGALLGSVALFAAAYNGTSPLWLFIIWAISSAVGAFAFGFEGADPTNLPAASPRRLFRRDRGAFAIITTVLATALGGAFTARTLADGHPIATAVVAGVSTVCTYGLTAGVVIAAATSRYLSYAVARSRHALRGDLPWMLMAFLEDAHRNKHALRTAGTAYQFRHHDLKERIAATPAQPRPTAGTRTDRAAH